MVAIAERTRSDLPGSTKAFISPGPRGAVDREVDSPSAEPYPRWLYDLAGVAGALLLLSLVAGLVLGLVAPGLAVPALVLGSASAAALAFSGVVARRYRPL
jgi:hypothetical protein